jgi:apolipoprotein N-acyltransferase
MGKEVIQKSKTLRTCILLTLYVLLTYFSIGDKVIPLAVWLAPIVMIRFLRENRILAGVTIGLLLNILIYIIKWNGILMFTGLMHVLIFTGVGILYFIPYIIDRLVHPKFSHSFLSTLVLPLSWSSTEFLFTKLGYGTWSLMAYSQYGNLPLLQIISITGMYGVTFLITWFASMINWVIEKKFAWLIIRSGVLLYLSVMLLVLLYGGARTGQLFKTDLTTVKVASISVDNAEASMAWSPFRSGAILSSDAIEENRDKSFKLHENLLKLTEREADLGAKIIFWSEANAYVYKGDEESLINRGKEMAMKKNIYLFMSLSTVIPGQTLVENKVIGIEPNGNILKEYLKTHPTPDEGAVPGDGVIQVINTPYGKIGWAICYDYDFPELIRQAGKLGADIMLNPSWDTKGMDPLHTKMATFRSIENGFTMIRQTNGGLSAASDYYGRILNFMDHYTNYSNHNRDLVMISYVPVEGVKTLYPVIGDLFAWTCVLGLLVLLVIALRSKVIKE